MATRLVRSLYEFIKREDGPTAVEYAVMLSLIVVACIGTIGTLGGNASSIFSSVFVAGGSGNAGPVGGTSWSFGSGSSAGVISFNSNGTYSYTSGGVLSDGGTWTQSGGQVQLNDNAEGQMNATLSNGTLTLTSPGQPGWSATASLNP